LAILLIKYFFWSSYAVIGGAFAGMGLISYGFKISLITTPFGIVLSYFLLQWLGISGVAWAQAANALVTMIIIYSTYPGQIRNYFSTLTYSKNN